MIFYKDEKQTLYQNDEFEFTGIRLSDLGLSAFLEDIYLNTQTPIDLSGTTKFRFEVMNIPGSYAANRFRVIFKARSSCNDNEAVFRLNTPGKF